MEIYTLDPLFRRMDVVDVFISAIWTERYDQTGDFQLDLYSNLKNRNLFKVGTLLAMDKSFRVMMVESIEDDDTSDDTRVLTIKGRSLEKILMDRVAMGALADTTTTPNWTLTGTPAAIMRQIFHDICVTGILSSQDIIPFITEGSFLAASTIPEPTDIITVEITPTTVYEALTNIAKVWGLGFRMLRHYDTSQIYWDVYTGSDRTSSQTVLPAVIFAPSLDNLQNTKALTSIEDAKNVAYVFSPAGFRMVYPENVDPEVDGFDRRVLMVEATEVTAETYTTPDQVAAALLLAGNNALAQAQAYQAFDGEITQLSQYRYGVDYQVGDLVEQRDNDGNANNMRVTEQIFVSDAQGERAYPTLTMTQFITAGSWLSWLPTKYWVDMGPTEFWANQP